MSKNLKDMKSTDLMVGDWVMAMLATPEPMKMEYIDNGGWLAHLEPIPLTPEILEANGWKKNPHSCSHEVCITIAQKHLSWSEDNKCVHISGGDINVGTFSSTYVHELQRFLRCSNMYDLADNFKLA